MTVGNLSTVRNPSDKLGSIEKKTVQLSIQSSVVRQPTDSTITVVASSPAVLSSNANCKYVLLMKYAKQFFECILLGL